MHKKIKELLFFIVILLFINSIYLFADIQTNTDKYAITVGINRKIYIINLYTDKIIKISKPFKEIGFPSEIDYDKNTGNLYVASENGWRQTIFYPLTIFKIKKDSIKLIKKFKRLKYRTLSKPKIESQIYEIYRLHLSPNGKKLYLGYGGYECGTVIFDVSSGIIISNLKGFYIRKHTMWFPNGKEVSTVFLPWKLIIKKKGKETIKKNEGYLTTYDLEKHKEIEKIGISKLITSERGLNPPVG